MPQTTKVEKITISKKLKAIITPLSKEEFQQLRNNIIQEGCREPLIVWEKDGKLILVDGHNRHVICTKNHIPFKVQKKKFRNTDEATSWMINNQLGRRNLNKDQMSYYRGLKYESFKKKRGGYGNVKSKGRNEATTSKLLAEEFKISESTIKRDAKFARGLNFIGKLNSKLKDDILSGSVKAKKSDVILFADTDSMTIKNIRNEADLSNKAKILRNELLSDIEYKLRKQNEEIVGQGPRRELQAKEPIFSDWQGRVQKVKGRIVSAINHAIESRDIEAIDHLKDLIVKLETLLLDE